jgi:hypothetical protein
MLKLQQYLSKRETNKTMNPNENPDQQSVPTPPIDVPPTSPLSAPVTEPEPQQNSAPDPVVAPVTFQQQVSQPVIPVTPTSNAFPSSSTPVASGFGSSTTDAFSSQQPTMPQQKKPINKKLIIIIASAVVVVGLVVAGFLLIPKITGSSSSSTTSLFGGIGKSSSLTTYDGDGFSISIPQSFKEVTNASTSTTPGVTTKSFNKTGQKSDTPTSVLVAASGPYTGTSQAEMSKQYTSIIKTPIPDSDTSKDNSFSKQTISGFDAFIGKGTSIDKGVKKSTAYSVYVLGKNKLYYFIINVLPEDESSIDADAMINSIKIN